MLNKKLIFILSIIIIIFSCGRKHNISKDDKIIENIPAQEFIGGTSIIMTDSGKVQWILKTKYMKRDNKQDKMLATPINFNYYGGKKKPLSFLTADKGESKGNNFDIFYVTGNVRINSTKGYKLKADNLHWDKASNTVTTPDRIRFKTKSGDILTGRGFRSDPDLDNWEILHDVKGELQDFEEKMGNNKL